MTVSTAFYVATNGNDSWSGTLSAPNAQGTDGPFASLERAKAAMEATPAIQTTYLRAGTYHLDQTLQLGAADSGQTWSSYPGEHAIISGGQVVSHWTAQGNGLYAATVASSAAQSLDISVTANGTTTRLAPVVGNVSATNPGGWQVVQGTAGDATHFVAAAGQAGDTLQVGDHLHVMNKARWADTVTQVTAIGAESPVVTLANPIAYGFEPGTTWQRIASTADLNATNTGFAWSASGSTLQLRLPGGGDPASKTITVATLGTLINAVHADHLTFSGLTFTDTQTGTGAALRLEQSTGATISGNVFSDVGQAVLLSNHADNATITNNTIRDIGHSGITTLFSDHSVISNNTLNGIGEIQLDGSGIFIYGGTDNTISGNHISDTGRAGIGLSSYGTTLAINNQVLNNDIRNTNLNTADMGGIYLYNGAVGNGDLNTVISGNRIENVGGVLANANGVLGPSRNTNGIYLDDLASGVTISNNLIIGAQDGAVFIHGGKDVSITNNIAVLSAAATYYSSTGIKPLTSAGMSDGSDLVFKAEAALFTGQATRIDLSLTGAVAGGAPVHFLVLVDGTMVGQGFADASERAFSFDVASALAGVTAHTVTIRDDPALLPPGATRTLRVGDISVNGQSLRQDDWSHFLVVQPSVATGEEVSSSHVTVQSNIIVAATPHEQSAYNMGAVIPDAYYDRNLLYNVSSAEILGISADAHSLSGDPLFIGNGNYHLQSGSPATNIGYVDPVGVAF